MDPVGERVWRVRKAAISIQAGFHVGFWLWQMGVRGATHWGRHTRQGVVGQRGCRLHILF